MVSGKNPSNISFQLNDVEQERFKQFREYLERTFPEKWKFDELTERTIYPQFTFHFTSTGVAPVVNVTEAITGLKCSLTDYDSW